MKILSILFLLLLLCSCTKDIGIIQTPPDERKFYSTADLSGSTLNGSTKNLLSNFQLLECYENSPEELLPQLERLYKFNRSPETVAALADASLQIGGRLKDNGDMSSRYFLASAVYSSLYLKYIDDKNSPYDETRIRMLHINNLAAAELFCYLKNRNLERASGYELVMPGVDTRKVKFSKPVFDLPLQENDIKDFTVCADFRTVNFTHDSKEFGLGVPLIASLKANCMDQAVGIPLPGFPLPVTLVADFNNDPASGKLTGTLHFLYSRTKDRVKLGKHTFPLAADFSTPLAKTVAMPQKMNFISRTLNVKEASDTTGLYLFEPYDDKRIPVIFVHGLMSDINTWGQMLNTLLHDKKIRQKYQFMGFSYSSGNPILVSASSLRQSLYSLHKNLIRQNRSTATFHKMILIGHSMGGLLSRLQISRCTLEHTADFMGIKNRKEFAEILTAEERKMIQNTLEFSPAPFIQRVIFIAVPHRGSEIARSWVGAVGASLIRLPVGLVKRNLRFMKALKKNVKKDLQVLESNTGIDNLRPDSPILKLLSSMPIAPGIPYHSIIGNNKKAFTPGGTDGIVPYWSSHLDQAVSELIVHSGHSAHCSPLAIQEVRQILLHHGKGNNTVSSSLSSKKPSCKK